MNQRRHAGLSGQLAAVDVKRLCQLEAENLKLKKLVAERDLEIDVMKEISRSSSVRGVYRPKHQTLAAGTTR